MSQIDPAERLLNLIIALTNARTRMTRAQIRATVAGYEPPAGGASADDAARREAAFERMFERDKDDIRRIGIPLQTVVDPTHGDEIGYRIDPSNSALRPMDFTQAELAVLGLAGEFWSDATVGADARQALTKVASSAGPRPQAPLPLAARSTAGSDAIVVIAEAIHRRQAVTFEYAASGAASTSQREVEPWRILFRAGAQYAVGFDRDRGEPRTFRLNRILGVVKPKGPESAYVIPDPLPQGEKRGEQPTKTALVALRPESGHSFRERGKAVGTVEGWDLFEIQYRYPDALRDAVLALAGGARIVEPQDLAAQVVEHARRALEVTRG